MNPSAKGWLKKLLKTLDKDAVDCIALKDFYPKLKGVGFVYGSNISVANKVLVNRDFTQEERCKINLILALLCVYKDTGDSIDNFVPTIKTFYKNIGFYKKSFIEEILGEDVELIIHKRIQIDNNIITRNFKYFVTNALLFMDVLAFTVFLQNSKQTLSYLKGLENTIRAVVSMALNSKSQKNKYDKSLIRLLESSLRLSESKNISFDALQPTAYSELERWYFLDLACMATWNDLKIDKGEQAFFQKFKVKFDFSNHQIEEAISSVNHFYRENKNHVELLSTKNLAERFYDNSGKLVKKLITRNSKKLYQELKESKELLVLLSQSTVRDLTDEEVDKMQEQLLDVLKSIPSLAIFMLPGGAVLLPLFIKFIPKLLPSAFDDNRIDDKS
ncbi:LETM1-related biofilm-associated protein [Flavobacteriaceae bacterium]|nr:LETM1-related biofilm-associated protein [Flavobacteriaceae bacterium]MDB2631479.1 LETM1-related biofilm-associated protein [Flavobacteriaceae bacterium]